MSSILDSIKRTARTGRLKTELLLLDREIRIREEAFGIQLYDYLEPLAQNPNFFSADDRLTQVLRPPLLEAQREIAVVYNKKTQLKERMKQAEAKRAAAFPKKAENWQEKLTNVAISTSLAGGEAKLKAEEMVLDNSLKSHKQSFGLKLYPVLEALEDNEHWLPTDREVRTIYDNCRRDIEAIRKKAKVKVDELETLGVSRKEIQQERDAASNGDQQLQQSQLGGGGGAGSSSSMYAAPPPAHLTPVHAPPAAAVAAPLNYGPPQDPFATTPTAALPVARPVNNPGYPSAETPVLAYATTSPTPPSQFRHQPQPYQQHSYQPQQPPQSHQQQQASFGFGNAGVGPIGGTPMGGAGAMMGGGPGANPPQSNSMMFGNNNNSNHDDDGGGFMMGGSAGMGMAGGAASSDNFVGQPHQQANADPWGSNDPFGSFAGAGAVPPPPPPPHDEQQRKPPHKDSNLFLY
ncbi:hypothetical protein ACA910_001036 [Epithemia clementina (nom. ined.)]